MPRHFAREIEHRRLRRAVRAWWHTASPSVLLCVPGAPATRGELDALFGDARHVGLDTPRRRVSAGASA